MHYRGGRFIFIRILGKNEDSRDVIADFRDVIGIIWGDFKFWEAIIAQEHMIYIELSELFRV